MCLCCAESKTRLARALLDMFSQFGSQQIRNIAVSFPLNIVLSMPLSEHFRYVYASHKNEIKKPKEN